MLKITYKPFSERTRVLTVHTYYYVIASNQDGSQGKLLGIVKKDGNTGKWTADGQVFPPAPRADRTPVRTRKEAADILLHRHLEIKRQGQAERVQQ